MRYHLFQKFCGKMVKIKETSFLSTRGAVCFALNCILIPYYRGAEYTLHELLD